MKRIIMLIMSIVLIIILIVSYNFWQYSKKKSEINKFNKTFLEYNKSNLYGTDITTVINKAMDNNKQFNISKNELEEYIPDEDNSIKIYIYLDNSNYPMEKFYKVGINQFTSYFGMLKFECSEIKYHKNGKISEMYFKSLNI